METRFNEGIVHFLLISLVGEVASQAFTWTSTTNGSQLYNNSSENVTTPTCRWSCTDSSGTSITTLTMVVLVIIIFIVCMVACCCMSRSRRTRDRQRERTRAESQQQLIDSYASIIIAVVNNLRASARSGENFDQESGQCTMKEFKGPPTYEEATKITEQPPPPYTVLDLSRSSSDRESNT